MKEILKNIEDGYVSGLKKARETSDIICPFCLEGNFDLIGLKGHFINYDCEEYKNCSTPWNE